MRALVTGGAGFIGSHVAQLLVEQGAEVLVIDDLSTGKIGNLPDRAEFVEQDVGAESISTIVEAFRPEAILHLAAQVDVRHSVHQPLSDARINVLGTLRLLEAARRCDCRRFVFSSTGGAIYGEQTHFPAAESHACAPVSPYGAAKLCAEEYIRLFERTGGPACTILRYANVYGPRQDPHGEAGVVAIFAGRMLAGQATRINGDGRQTRDFVFVSDVAQANRLAVEQNLSGVFNIGTGIETDINELHRRMSILLEIPDDPAHGPPAAGEQRRSCIDPGLACRQLGWSPATSLDEGLKATLDFFRDERDHG